jgi:hypothetical protein
MVFGSYKYKSTLNRRFNKLVKDGIIADTYSEIIKKYITENEINELIIDSMDTMNGNCNKLYTDISHKLHKQAVRTTIIGTKNRIPLMYQTDPARKHDSNLGFSLASRLKINDGKIHYLVGDKGYQMNKENKVKLLKNNKLKLVVPKKKYKRKKKYKTKNYQPKIKKIRHSKQMKDALKLRIKIEHINSVIHRSFKRLNIIYDKSINVFNSFIELAIICIIIHDSIKESVKTNNK